MTDYDALDYAPLLALAEDEVVTHSHVRDVRTPSGKVIALITLDNGLDYKRPNTLGPRTLEELEGVLIDLQARAARGDIHAVAEEVAVRLHNDVAEVDAHADFGFAGLREFEGGFDG